MLRRYCYIIILFSLPLIRAAAQTTSDETYISLAYPVYSQYLHNGLLINPAYAGSREVLSLFSSARTQWLGIDGAPTLETISLHSLLKNDKVGLGFSAQFLQYGVTKSNSFYADYAYHLIVRGGKLSLGLRGGIDMSNTDFTGIKETLNDPNDPVFQTNDKPYYLPNVGSGFYYYNKKFFFGAAVPSFLAYKKNSAGDISMAPFANIDILASAGVLVTFSQRFKLKPSVFIDYSTDKTKGMRIYINANLIIYDFVWIGGSWRTSENVAVGIIQLQVTPQLMLGYSYDFPIGSMNTYSDGSHEVVFRYEFGKKISAANPRYF
jgi:type IX secretion system PorP/SprF family membrane protein